jgi:hypothetical protein
MRMQFSCAIYFNKLVSVLLKILQPKRFSPFKKYDFDTEYSFKEYKAKLENYEYGDFQTFYQDNNNMHSDEEYFNIIRTGIRNVNFMKNGTILSIHLYRTLLNLIQTFNL